MNYQVTRWVKPGLRVTLALGSKSGFLINSLVFVSYWVILDFFNTKQRKQMNSQTVANVTKKT